MEPDNAKDLDVVLLTYDLIEYSNNYSKTSGGQWQYYREIRTDSESFRFKVRITGKTPAAGNTKDVEVAVPLK